MMANKRTIARCVIRRAFFVPFDLFYCMLAHPPLTKVTIRLKMVEASTNFVLLNDDEIADLIDASDATNTKKRIKFAVGRLNSYA